jgi:hypothetical protein
VIGSACSSGTRRGIGGFGGPGTFPLINVSGHDWMARGWGTMAKSIDQQIKDTMAKKVVGRTTEIEVWQRFAGKWATGATGQKPCATTAQPLLI